MAECSECGREFFPDNDETDVCRKCQIEYLAEEVPESGATPEDVERTEP